MTENKSIESMPIETMPIENKQNDLSTRFSQDDVEVEQRQRAYDGFFKLDRLRIKHKRFQHPQDLTISRELFVRGDAVGVLPYDPDHNLLALIEQFRVGALAQTEGPWCLEVVAGMVESGESPQQVAERELQEEANIVAKKLDYIGSYLSSPGGTDEKLHLFCAICDLRQAEGVFGLDSEGEDIRVRVFDADKLLASLYTDGLIGDRAFNNAATLISLQWLYSQVLRVSEPSR